jgi:hypothetical protein
MMLPEDWLKQLQSEYPRRSGGQGWGHVRKRVPELVRDGHDFDAMLEGCKSYGRLMKANNKWGTEWVMQARTFFGPGEWWLEDYSPVEYVKTVDDEAAEEGLERAPGESDEHLRERIGTAQTRKMYRV